MISYHPDGAGIALHPLRTMRIRLNAKEKSQTFRQTVDPSRETVNVNSPCMEAPPVAFWVFTRHGSDGNPSVLEHRDSDCRKGPSSRTSISYWAALTSSLLQCSSTNGKFQTWVALPEKSNHLPGQVARSVTDGHALGIPDHVCRGALSFFCAQAPVLQTLALAALAVNLPNFAHLIVPCSAVHHLVDIVRCVGLAAPDTPKPKSRAAPVQRICMSWCRKLSHYLSCNGWFGCHDHRLGYDSQPLVLQPPLQDGVMCAEGMVCIAIFALAMIFTLPGALRLGVWLVRRGSPQDFRCAPAKRAGLRIQCGSAVVTCTT